MTLNNLPSTSRIWIYSADRFLNKDEQSHLSKNLTGFVQGWAAHSKELFGAFEILHDNFVVIGVDESKIPASGCSIDTLTHFIKAQGNELNINFFNRLSVLLEKDGEYKRVDFSELTQNTEWNVFNPLVMTLAELRANWLIPVGESEFVK